MMTLDISELRLGRAVLEAEEAADEFISKLAALQQLILQSRGELDLPRRTGQSALMRIGKASELGIAAASALHVAHAELVKTGEDVRAAPDQGGECPWPDTTTGFVRDAA